ncbi:PKD domain-containing protein [Aquimarina sp. MMG016]|uniref:PKD domain-containing protein n=1 Tax=Aquimarina sp. MMG016 TaxID=2822690 RepID=UPI001B3A5C2D|nr:PKD domain-containing protein [Aquimarina sp. MMG016]MBQ4821011.1 PKD domain-containing protein [Aquimarina sp. MMG016]
MINSKILRKSFNTAVLLILAVVTSTFMTSCDYEFDLPEAGSIPDETPPAANFTATQSALDFLRYDFANLSTSATTFAWDFGDGNTSTEKDGVNMYPAEGTYTVTLTASDALGVTSTFSLDIEVIEPEEPDVPDPILVNADFDKLPKSSGSDCTCSGWINKSIGDQGESSSGNGGSDNVLKFDNNEPDHIYQEFEVVPNADYTIQIVTSFKSPEGGSFPSMLELRVLAGSGYTSGYTPTYYTDTAAFPQDGFGYASISQVEDPANNLLVETQANPSDDSYITYTYIFNAGANDSVALFIRGIGGPATGGGGGDFGYNSGDEEIRADSITITAINE